MSDYTEKTGLLKPAIGQCNWNLDWWQNADVASAIMYQLAQRDNVISGGALTNPSGLTIDITDTNAMQAGLEVLVGAGSVLAVTAPVGASLLNYIYITAGEFKVTQAPPTETNYILLGTAETDEFDTIFNLVDLRQWALARIDYLESLQVENDCINGYMDVWQRGIGPFYSTTMLADRWLCEGVSATMTTQQALLNSTVTGKEDSSPYALRLYAGALTDAVNGLVRYKYRLPNIEKYIGKKIQFESVAKFADGLSIGFRVQVVSDGTAVFPAAIGSTQTFAGNGYQAIAESFDIPEPSTNGTIGVNSYIEIQLYTTNGTAFSAVDWYVGEQLGVSCYLASVKMYASDVVLPVRRKTFAETLHECQYYYHTIYNPFASTYSYAGSNSTISYGGEVWFPREMRIIPAVTHDTGLFTNCSLTNVSADRNRGVVQLTPVGAPIVYRWYQQTINFDAEL